MVCRSFSGRGPSSGDEDAVARLARTLLAAFDTGNDTRDSVAVRFLPAHSPDLNPSETTWSKIKALLRAAEARNAEHLQLAIARALQRVTAQDAAHRFAACGYGINQNAPAFG